MSKDKRPADMMAHLAGVKKPSNTIEHVENTQVAQSNTIEHVNLDTFSIRLSSEDKERLRQHFDGLGLRLAPGLRMVIKKYMRDESI